MLELIGLYSGVTTFRINFDMQSARTRDSEKIAFISCLGILFTSVSTVIWVPCTAFNIDKIFDNSVAFIICCGMRICACSVLIYPRLEMDKLFLILKDRLHL